MVGLGTILFAITAGAFLLLWKDRLVRTRAALKAWVLMLAWPFPYIATTAGWMSAELGRQPWLVYGLMKTPQGTSLRLGYFTYLDPRRKAFDAGRQLFRASAVSH